MIFLVVVLSILPIVISIIWMIFITKYSTKSAIELFRFFLLGIFISVFVIFIEEIFINLNVFDGYLNFVYNSFIVAGLTEEGVKALVFVPILFKRKNFNKRLDGITYSVYTSLGFAAVENIIYLVTENRRFIFQLAINRGILSIPAHIMFAISMGYYLSKAKFSDSKKKRKKYIALAVFIPIIFHSLYDLLIVLDEKWSLVIFFIYSILLLKFNLDNLDKYIDNSKKIFVNNLKTKNKVFIEKLLDKVNRKKSNKK